MPSFKKHFTSTFNLKQKMKGITIGLINYPFRNQLTDDRSSDDYIYIDFSSEEIEFKHLLEVVQANIEDLDAYSLSLYPEDVIFSHHYRNMPF